jgi:hypothetical protein
MVMQIFKRKPLTKVLILVIISLSLLATAGYFVHARTERPQVEEEVTFESFGVIDYEVLIKEHPSFSELLDLEKQVMSIDPEPLDSSKMEKIGSALGKKMDEYQKQIEQMLEKERDQIFQETTAKIKVLQEKLNTEYEKKSQDLMKYKEQLEKEYQTGEQKPLTEFEKKFTTRMQVKTKDLLILKERQVAARRLELLKKSQERLLSKRDVLEAKAAEFEDKLRNQNQNMKLDLQLKLQVAKTDEERGQIQSQLEKLYNDEQNQVDEYKKELMEDFKKLEDEEAAKNETLLKQYEAKVDNDVGKQIEKIRQVVAEEMVKEGLLAGDANSFIPTEIKNKFEARQKQVEQEMKQLQEQINQQVAALEKQSQEEFEVRKTGILNKLESYQAGLAQEFDRKRNELIKEMESANTEKTKARKDLLERRKQLYDKMILEINEKVHQIAETKKIDVVLGYCEVNVNAVDLTEEVKPFIRELKSNRTNSNPSDEDKNSETRSEK